TNLILQVLSVAPYPLLARLYTPEQFSTFALFNSIVLVALVVATGKYDAAIVVAKKHSDAVRLMFLTLLVAVAAVGITVLILLIDIQAAAALSVRAEYLVTVPFVLLLAALVQIGRAYYNRKGHYQAYSRNLLLQRGSSVAVSLAAGLKAIPFNGLILGAIVGFAVSGGAVFFSIAKLFRRKIWYKNISKVAQAFQDFPAFSAPLALINIVSAQLPLYVFYHYFSEFQAGQYAMAYRLLSIPESIVSASIATVFFREFSKAVENRVAAIKLVSNIWKQQFLIGVVPFIFMLLWGDELVVWVLGQKWEQAGNILVVLITAFFFQFISIPTSSAFVVLRRQKVGFIFGALRIAASSVSLAVGYYYQSMFTALYLLVILEVVQVLVYNTLLYKTVREYK
ncbi:MAG: oligosaccharide flippase family protein, partial [Hymenobacteraceae bacterium]|nr:oligosaccharide flippase family protein [Hymenobacteraceae bacterium]MDX5513217.1 oligosaccharide flippase family protein [Hymenobacteraceae bacterium]